MRALRLLLFFTIVTTAAWAGPDSKVTGTLKLNLGAGNEDVTFSCTGTPTCNGTYTIAQTITNCTNTLTNSDQISITGLNLDTPTTNLSGNMVFKNRPNGFLIQGGICTITGRADFTAFYFGTWNGTTGTTNGLTVGTFTATGVAPPVFPLTVTSNINSTTANASAQFQPRSQDVGTTASIFVFAHVPASTLRKEAMKYAPPGGAWPFEAEDDDYCVLTQLGAGGTLSAASSSTMQAYSTGVLTSQGQAVTILNNVSTPNVSGATFYVGYGANASAMFSNGVYQAALTVPGTSQCTASTTSSAVPNTPGPLTGLWYNANESGWGAHFTQRRNIVFAAWYTYDANGNPKWYVASSCAMPAGTTGATGTCTGTLYEVSGPTFFGTTFNPSLVNVATAGTLTVNFANANSASMSYTANGQSRTVAITRQVFATGTTQPAVDFTDLWYNSTESGWGLAISHQFGVMFLAWYVYDNTGKPVWYVASNCAVAGNSCSGTLYRTTGPPLGPTFNPSQVQVFTAGTVSVSFSDPNNATLSYTVNGVTSTKAITRQVF